MRYLMSLECGGSLCRAGIYDESGRCAAEHESAGANLVDRGIASVSAVVAEAYDTFRSEHGAEDISEIAAAVAGAGTGQLSRELAIRLVQRFSVERTIVSDDLTPLISANLSDRPGILAVAGTGSSVVARDRSGVLVHIGGHGHIFSEPGSAYAVGSLGLRRAAEAVDGYGPETSLTTRLPEAVGLIALEDLRKWGQDAGKTGVAALARTVSVEAQNGDAVAERCLAGASEELARQIFAAAERARLEPPVYVILHGGLVENSSVYRKFVEARLCERWPDAEVELAAVSGHEAVAQRAMRSNSDSNSSLAVVTRADIDELRATESRSESVTPIDLLNPHDLVAAMQVEDLYAAEAAAAAGPQVTDTIDCAIDCFENGGRIIYVGAGTSGRLGVLDASECYPTFGVPPERVVGFVAGGDDALRNSIEGAEDNTEQAVADLEALDPGVSQNDLVIGVSASGTTPYVRSALKFASDRGARTAIVTCNPVAPETAEHCIYLDTGPERLPGSTRLKAGTATKMVLNQISTGALTLCGYVYDGYMVGVTPTNSKLRARAIRILSQLLESDTSEAEAVLDAADGSIPVAVAMVRLDTDRKSAIERLEQAGGSLRRVLER